MYNRRSTTFVQNSSYLEKDFCAPLYESYGFSQIPATIERLLLGGDAGLPDDVLLLPGKEYEFVLFLLLDGFGWRFFIENVDRYPFLQRLVAEGVISQITSQFPSTTAAHVTTLYTGLPVGQSGVYEWFLYEPLLDTIIAPLTASYGGETGIDTLPFEDFASDELYPKPRFFERLERAGVSSYALMPNQIVDSFYSRTMLRGATAHGYADLEEGLSDLVQLTKEGGKKCLYFYYPELDSVAHRHGVTSAEFEKELDYMLNTLQEKLSCLFESDEKRGALLITADHGLIDIDPKATFYLNEEFPAILPLIEQTKSGKGKVPAGSSRDFFLHIVPERLQEAEAALKDVLSGLAHVVTTEKLIADGIFGTVSKRFLERVGNLVLLPRSNHSIWWHEKKHYGQHFYAMHGGMSRHEMETIFLMGECL